jgi:hypothetical protein
VTIGAFGDKHKAQALGVTYAAIAHQYIAWSTERPDLFPAMKFPFGGIYSKKRLVSPSAAETDLRPPPTSD